MSMPKVVCSTTEWVLTIRLSETISKKRMPRFGDSVSTTKPNLRDHPKSCPNDRNYIAGLWMPGIQIHSCYCTPVTIASSAPLVTTALSVKTRANAYRSQSLIRQPMKSTQPHLHTRSPQLYQSRLE